MLVFMAVFAFGETLMQPTIPAISNDLAADHTRGRYNAINAAAFQGGAIAGPIVAGPAARPRPRRRSTSALMVLGCLVICVMAMALERRIPAAANGVEEIAPAVGPPADTPSRADT